MTRNHFESQSFSSANHIAFQLKHDALRQKYDALITITKKKRSSNHSDSSTFIDDVNLTWRIWKIKMHDKMMINKNHFEIFQVEITIVISWTIEKIDEHIQIVRNLDINHFKNHQQMMKFLDSIYDDFDYKRNIRIKFKTLIMRSQDFQSFFSIFLLLSSQIDYNETQKIEKLLEKLSFSLRKTLSVYSRQFAILIEVRIEFTQMYNNQKRIRKKKVEMKIAQSQCFVFISFKITSVVSKSMHFAKSTIHFHWYIEFSSRSRDLVTDTLIFTSKCFICDELKHTWKLCFNAKQYKKRQWHDLQMIQMNMNIEFNDSDSMRIFSTRDDSMFDFFVKKSLVINCILFFDSNQHRLEALIDIDVTSYAFIDKQIARLVCDMLHMKLVSLLKSKLLIEFDDRYVLSITHVIYFKLTIELHFELIALLLIIDLNNHSIILKKSWINKHEIILNMTYDKLIFKRFKCNHHDNIFSQVVKVKRLEVSESNRRWNVISWRRDVVLSNKSNAKHIATAESRYTILSRSKIEFSTFIVENESITSNSEINCCNESLIFEQNKFEIDITDAAKTFSYTKTLFDIKRTLKTQRNQKWKIKKQQQFEFASLSNLNSNDSVNIIVIEAIFFCLLIDIKDQKQKMKCFFITINQIDFVIKTLQTNFESLEINVIIEEILEHEQMKSILKRLMKQVSKYFHNLFEVFSFQKIVKLSSHRFYDHKIELLNDANSLFRNRIYSLFLHKFHKLKKYLKNNLQKDFIAFSKVAFVSLVLFVVKLNDQLRLCVNYRRLNQFTKRNRYSISLIEEILTRMQDCKYLIKLKIVSSLNKFRMSSKSEKLITFVTFMSAYKYRVVFFDLTNDQINWQHYMNDLLFDFLNNFCQIALNDILIYNKFKKKHIAHVRVILKRLKEIDLQVNIEKCEFFKKKIVFLSVLLSIDDLRMNSKNIEIIINWKRSINLKKMQIFVNFVKFYRRFIRNFSKKIEILTRMTKKLVKFEWIAKIEKIFNLLKKTMIEIFIFRYYDRIKQVVLKIDFSNYVNAKVLSQYDDEKVLHLVVFYNRNLISIECNYEIYDKKLLIIIRCLKHWRFELENIDESIKILIDHKNLKIFMNSKKLTSRQTRWAEILSKFNIVIQFQSKTQNVKADVLIRMSNSRLKNDNDERHQYRKQMLFISKRLEIHFVKFEKFIYERVFVVNKVDDDCKTYRDALEQNLTSMNEINLRDCHAKNDVLYRDDRFWMSVDVFLLIDLLREIHEFRTFEHSEFNRMKYLLKRNYYWSKMRKTVRQYVRNCHECQRNKTFKNHQNDLLTSLIILLRRWENISMNFITELSNVHDYNFICTIIDRLSMKRHYVFCTIENENTNVEIAVEILVQYVFRIHDLFFSITSNRDFQFILLVWQIFCRILRIKCKLFIVSHSEIDEQIEKVNQNIERQLRQYCNYMQDDWDIWILMTKFADNNAISATTKLFLFFVNKRFHSRMSFSSNSTSYTITRERLLIVKAKNIIDTMQNILNYVRNHAKMTQKRMTTQINKRRKLAKYVEKNFVFLNRRNIKIAKSFDKLDDKRLNSFKMIQRLSNFYRFELFEIMRIHDVFHCWLLRKNLRNSFENQINESSNSIIVNENFEWEINNILKFRYHYNRLQYRVNWANWSQNRTWYYANNEKFDNARDVVNDHHRAHFIVANSKSYKSMIVVSQTVVDEENSSASRRRSRKKIVVLILIEITFN